MSKQNYFLVTDSSELVSQVTSGLKQVLQTELQDLKMPQKQNSAEYLTRADVAERFHCSLSTVDRLSSSNVLKAIKLGHRTLFRVTDIEEALIQINNSKGGTNYDPF